MTGTEETRQRVLALVIAMGFALIECTQAGQAYAYAGHNGEVVPLLGGSGFFGSWDEMLVTVKGSCTEVLRRGDVIRAALEADDAR